MHDDSPVSLARARLRVLIGTAIEDLPADFITRLGRVLAEEQGEDAGPCGPPRLMLVRTNQRDATSQAGGHAASARASGQAELHDKVRGLEAILEMLHAAHLDRREYPTSPALSEGLLEGLILAGRELVGAMAAEPT